MSNHHRRKHAAAHWSSLSPDLVNSVGDILLADGDVDYYMSLRAVCHTWRAATDDPRSPDRRFRPRGWAILGSLDGNVAQAQDTRLLFLNVNTDRFLWKDLPVFRGYACLANDDVNGLLVLRAKSDSTIWALNPITGYLVRLALSLANLATTLKVAADADGSTTRVLYTFWDSCHVVRNHNGPAFIAALPVYNSSVAVVDFKSRAYAVDREGTVTVVKGEQAPPRTVAVPLGINVLPLDLDPPGTGREPLSTFLVNNAGELLVVRLRTSEGSGAVQLFRVDLEGKTLHAITSIGNRAVFLGRRCLSVDARKLPGIQGNCIYYVGGGWEPETRGICMYRVEDGSHERLFEPPYDTRRRPHTCLMVAVLKFPPQRPLSLLQVLMDYPKYAPGNGNGCRDWQY